MNDNDLVYVDPDKRVVIGPVEWTKDGKPVKKERIVEDKTEDEEENGEKPEKGKKRFKRKKRKSYYPWGSYRTMKKLYRIEGKEKEEEGNMSLDEAMQRSIKEPFWD